MVLEDGTRHTHQARGSGGLRGAEVRADDRVAQSRERVPAHRARRAASASCASRSCRRAPPSCRRRASRRTTRSWRSTRSSPCRWRASCSRVLGLALGASNRKDGKLAAFVLGIGVIFAYYVIMFTARGADEGRSGSRRGSSMWMPEHRPRRRRRLSCWSVARARPISRFASRCRRGSRAGVAERRRPPAPRRPAPRRGRGRAAGRRASACRTSSCPGRRCSTSTSRSSTCRILAMTTVGMLGLFYISTFIDMSDKLFKGQATLGMIAASSCSGRRRSSCTYIIAHRGAALGARDRRPADQEQRADRHARVRHQPLSHGAADGGVRARRQRVAVRHGRTRAGHRQPARRPSEAHHPHRHRRRPSACSIASGSSAATARSITTSIYDPRRQELQQPVGVRVRSARRTRSSRGMFVQQGHLRPPTREPTARPQWALEPGLDRASSIRQTRSSSFTPFDDHVGAASSRPTTS